MWVVERSVVEPSASPHERPAPWPAAPLHRDRLSVTFQRALDLPYPACVAALVACPASVGPARLGASPRLTATGEGWCVPVVLRPGWGAPSVAMTLHVFPWFETFGTRLALQPIRPVRGGRRYFAAGHAFLDRLTRDWA